MALGTYKIPKELSSAEKSSLKVTAAYSGLQPDFKKWVQTFVDAAKDKGFDTLVLNDDGYVSYPQAAALAKNGNSIYLDHAELFCRGLAWEYSWSGSNNRNAMDWVDKHKSEYGLASFIDFDADTNVVKTRYFYPRSIEKDESLDGTVSYDGDMEGNGLASASGASSASAQNTSGSVASVAYFFSNQFRTIEQSAESELLHGERALANDAPVFNTIESVVKASMRSFSSTPDGRFIAWYPDFWGKAGNTPCMTIKDIELLDLKITQSDKTFYSHVYCTGVRADGSPIARQMSQGVVSIESNLNALTSEAELIDAGASDVSDEVSYILKQLLYIPEGEEWKYTPKELYRRYGARPTNADLKGAKVIENPDMGDSVNPAYIMPFLYALYSFMEHWSEQNHVEVTITFNPSIIPGCRIKLESLDVSFYVSGVTHNMDYSSGFTTSITAKCPKGSLVSGMVNV